MLSTRISHHCGARIWNGGQGGKGMSWARSSPEANAHLCRTGFGVRSLGPNASSLQGSLCRHLEGPSVITGFCSGVHDRIASTVPRTFLECFVSTRRVRVGPSSPFIISIKILIFSFYLEFGAKVTSGGMWPGDLAERLGWRNSHLRLRL
ncbi:hypothetical protein BD779DRAFT_431414 [Infundibulicybe gibba]|nr:hypothetical protein BD779DRAFT_431414 [Infundibulicybe gibba]